MVQIFDACNPLPRNQIEPELQSDDVAVLTSAAAFGSLSSPFFSTGSVETKSRPRQIQ